MVSSYRPLLLLLLAKSIVAQERETITCGTSKPVRLGWNETSGKLVMETSSAFEESSILVRECECASSVWKTKYYCPMETESCGFEYGLPDSVTCYQAGATTNLLRAIWPLVLLWFPTLLLFLFCSYRVSYAVRFCVSCLFPNMDTSLAEHLMQNPQVLLQRRYKMILHRLDAFNLTAFVLRTTIFHAENKKDIDPEELSTTEPDLSSSSWSDHCEEDTVLEQGQRQNVDNSSLDSSFNDDDAITCSICIGTLEEGDRIAKLDCHHFYHIDCIKSWCARKNACPLCGSQVATPAVRGRASLPLGDGDASNNDLPGVSSSDVAGTTQPPV